MPVKTCGPVPFGWKPVYVWQVWIDDRLQRGTIRGVDRHAAMAAADLRYCPKPGAKVEVRLFEFAKATQTSSGYSGSSTPPSTKVDALVAKTARSWIEWNSKQAVTSTGIKWREQQLVEAGHGSGTARDAMFDAYRREGFPIDDLYRLAAQFLEHRKPKKK